MQIFLILPLIEQSFEEVNENFLNQLQFFN